MENRLTAALRDSALETPALVIDFDTITHNYHRFQGAFPGGSIFYAMKANANPQVLQHIARLGGGFEIASPAELGLALNTGVGGERIICSNPIKTPQFIRQMHSVGVYAMVVDSTFEVDKVAQWAPGARVYVRLSVDNSGAVLPLAGKFGVDGMTALSLCDRALELGLKPIGIMFHVGSQCLVPDNWANAIRAVGSVWRMAAERGHRFTFLDLGGGYPAGHYHTTSIPTIEAIGARVMETLHAHLPTTEEFMFVLEPGRGLVGEAGRLLLSVIGKAQRDEKVWLYLDAGVFNGLMETYEGFPPVVSHLNDEALVRPLRTYTLAGPSCDSCDVIARDVILPEVHIDDRLVFFDAGAYTNEYAAAFNGFPIPAFIPLEAMTHGAQPFDAVYDFGPT
jgi:ornithine decarboxylase